MPVKVLKMTSQNVRYTVLVHVAGDKMDKNEVLRCTGLGSTVYINLWQQNYQLSLTAC